MMGMGNNGKLTRELIVAYDARQGQMLEMLGKITAKLEAMEANQADAKNEIKTVDDRVTKHIQDHGENPEIMGASPFLKKYTKKHWKVVIIILFAAQIAMAVVIAKYGIKEIIELVKKI